MARDKDEHDADERHGRLLATSLQTTRLETIRPLVHDRVGVEDWFLDQSLLGPIL